jgi:uncharacterized protein YcbK (DUF882 family)
MPHISRRTFLTATTASLSALALPQRVIASVGGSRALDLNHTHTGEQLSIVYWDGGEYRDKALQTIERFLGDFRTGDIHVIDPGVLDILHALRGNFAGNGSFEIISAYRSPATNATLASRSSSVAKKSLHMQGRAIDVRLQGVPLAELRDAALKLQAGGVGYYPKSDFIHVDTGRVRRW